MIDANAMAKIRIVRGADGHRYVHDPHFLFPRATHVHIPQNADYLYTDGPSGLGAVTALEQGATMALNFIPGVGPILSGVASLVEGLFGGGDPTPEWKLEEEVLQLRDAIAQAHQSLGIADSFHLNGPIGGGANNPHPLEEAVTEGNGGHPVASSDWRKGLYAAISYFQSELQPLSQQVNDQQVVGEVLTALHQSPVLPQTDATSSPGQPAAAPAADSGFAQEAQQYGPWALGGVMGVAVLFLMASAIGGSKKK